MYFSKNGWENKKGGQLKWEEIAKNLRKIGESGDKWSLGLGGKCTNLKNIYPCPVARNACWSTPG